MSSDHTAAAQIPDPTQVNPELDQNKLGWFDGFSLAMAVPNGVVISLGYTIGAIGTIGAFLVWVTTSIVAYLQNNLYAEMALMFRGESGGIALFANEGWKRYFTLAGPIATFGYWLGWSLTLGVVGETIGSLVQGQWFPDSTWSWTAGPISFSFPQMIAVLLIFVSWLVNIFGIRIAAWVVRVCAMAFLAFLAMVVLAPVLTGHLDLSKLTWRPGSITIMLVWMYVAAWTVYSSEIAATFAPEYRDETRDTARALRYSALLVVGVYAIVPLISGGSIGEDAIAANPITFTVSVLQQAYGTTVTDVALTIIIAELVLTMVAASADGGRVIFAMAQNGLTVRQFDYLNRFNEPSRALTLDLLVNVTVVLVVASPLAILLAANFGYMLTVILAVSSFLLLRRDRPDAKRPIHLGTIWIPIAWALLAFDILITVEGILHPDLAGYGSANNVWAAVGALALAVGLYYVRRVFQDGKPFRMRSSQTGVGDTHD